MNTTTTGSSGIESLKAQLLQLKSLHDSGALSPDAYKENKDTLERKLLDLVMSGAPASAPALPAQSLKEKTPLSLILTISLTIVLIAFGGYWWKGTPTPPAGNAASVSGEPAATEEEKARISQIAGMIERLVQITKENPKDPEGWTMLGRAQSVIGRHPEAVEAFEKAIALRKDDPTLMVDYADALAMKNNTELTGEPMKWVMQALKLDPKNLKALSMAGSDAFTRKDFSAAVKYWSKVAEIGPADNPMVQWASANLLEARQLAGMPVGSALAAATVPVTASANPSSSQVTGKVSGSVALAPALKAQAKPDDTVFVYARAAQGSRMPLAILRKQVRDLPFTFTLDDSSSMSPASKISGATEVMVSARVSRSGEAMPQPGDLTGEVGPVKVGASGLRVEIRDQVKP